MRVEDAFKTICSKASWHCSTDSLALAKGVTVELERYPLCFQTFTGSDLIVKCDICRLPDESYERNDLLKLAGKKVAQVWLDHQIYMTTFKKFIRLELRLHTDQLKSDQIIEKIQIFLDDCDSFQDLLSGEISKISSVAPFGGVGLML
ncbi:MAG: hypothetical protein ACI4NE_05790 [Succinivibrio sp.]